MELTRPITSQSCALPGCFKPRCPSVRPGDAPPLACGNFHHQLLMACRFNHLDPYVAIRHRNNEGFCALFSCAEQPHEGHSWCSRTHYLLWLSEFTSNLHPEYQICMLPDCTRHVYVDDNGSPSQFCGWQHKQEFVRFNALQHRQQEPLCPSVTIPPQQPPPPPSPASLNESECGHLPSSNSQLYAFKQFTLFGTPPKNISVDDDFYYKDPWEVLKEGHACWLIACPKFTSRGSRQLTTKGSYHWKQSGKPTKKNGYTVKYYTYTEMTRKAMQGDQQRGESSYTMQEFMLKDVKSHSLIYLVRKELSRNHHSADQIDNTCFQDTETLSSIDDSMLDDFLDNSLSCDDDLHQDIYQYHGYTDPHGLCQNGSADSDQLMFGGGVAEAQVVLDMFSFPLDFPYSARQHELLQGGYHIPS